MTGRRLAFAALVVAAPMTAGWAQDGAALYLAPGGLVAEAAGVEISIGMVTTSEADTVKSATKLWGDPVKLWGDLVELWGASGPSQGASRLAVRGHSQKLSFWRFRPREVCKSVQKP